jgi:hypothetical protein
MRKASVSDLIHEEEEEEKEQAEEEDEEEEEEKEVSPLYRFQEEQAQQN